MGKTKRILSILIAALMILALVPFNAIMVFAADVSSDSEETQTQSVSDASGSSVSEPADSSIDTEEELASALTAGGNVVLGADIELAECITIPSGVTATLDLNGYDITVGYQEDSTTKHIYALQNNGDLTIKDSVGTGSITARGIYNGTDGADNTNAKLTVNGAKIVNQDFNGGSCVWSYGGNVYLNNANLIGYTGCVSSEGYLEINGGTYTCYSGIDADGNQITGPTYNIRAYNGLKITDGEFTSRHGVIALGGGVGVIEDGSYTIEFTATTTSNVVYLYGDAVLTIEDGEFISDNSANKADSGAAVVVSGDSAQLTINDGTYVGMSGMVSTNVNTVINGGSYDTVFEDKNHYGSIESAVAEGAVITVAGTAYEKTEEGLETSDYVAKVGNTYYSSVADAIAAANAGDTVELVADVESLPTITKAITIDGNGHKVTGECIEDQFATIDGTVVLQNLVYEVGKAAIRTQYKSSDYTKLTIKVIGCTFNNVSNYAIMGGATIDGTELHLKELYVEGCIFNLVEGSNTYAVWAQSVSTVTVKDCVFNGNGAKGAIHLGESLSYATVATIESNEINSVQRGVQIGNRVDGTAITIADNTFDGIGGATKNGAIYIHSNATVDGIENLSITNNCFENSEYAPIYCDNFGEDETKALEEVTYTGNTTNDVPVDMEGNEFVVDLTISTAEELKAFADSVNAGDSYSGKIVVLANDIDLQGSATNLWTPIGASADSNPKFRGTFDGQGYTIKNLYVKQGAAYHAAGLFGATNGTIKNLTIDGAYVESLSSGSATVNGTAVVAGSTAYGATIDNVHVKNATVKGNRYVAGIVGYMDGTVTNCSVENVKIVATPDNLTGSYDNGDKVGGIVGYTNSNATEISGCELLGTVSITGYRDIGGLVGMVGTQVVVSDNTNSAEVTITVDQNTGYYGDKDANAGEFIGRGTAAAESTNNVATENATYTEKVIEYVELPTATVTPIVNNEVLFGLNFKADAMTEEQKAAYSDYLADFVITFNSDITLGYGEGTDGWLAGSYSEWAEGAWVQVPLSGDTITLKANTPYRVMEIAAEIMGKDSLQVTYADVAAFANGFSCGVYLTPEYVEKNPNFNVELGLSMYEPVAEGETAVELPVTCKDAEGKEMQTTFTSEDIALTLPTATVKPVINPDLSFGLTFVADPMTDAQLDYYGDWYADFVIVFEGLGEGESIVLGTGEGADGWLSGQYDAWSENWVDVPYTENVTIENGTSIKVMDFAAKLMGKEGLKVTYAKVAAIKEFNCGVYLTPEFVEEYPNFSVGIGLSMFEEVTNADGTTKEVEYTVTCLDEQDKPMQTVFTKTDIVYYVASITDANGNTTYYTDLKAAFAALKDGDTLTILAGEYAEGTIKLKASLKNVTIKGEDGAILKDMTIMASDGNSIVYEGITFDNIKFDNSRISITGWRTGEVSVKDMTVTNCEFVNLYDTTSSAPVHINVDPDEPIENFTFTNNVIDGATGGQKSGLYLQATGNVVIENNTINNVSFRPYVIQITTNDGIADNFTVTGNTFSGSAAGRAQGLGNNAEGTDTVNLVVSNNIFKDITNAQQICYWNFNPETTTADISKNYYDIDIVKYPGMIYYNSAAQSPEELVEMGVFPIYKELNEDGTINLDSEYTYNATPAYVAQDTLVNGWTTVWGQITIKGTENFYIEIYSGETYLGKTTLVDTDKVLLNGNSNSVTWHAFLDGSDSWWNTEWVVTPNCANVPTNVKYFVDDQQVGGGVVKMSRPDDLNPVVWSELRGVSHVYESVVTEPTCMTEGYTTYTCVCGDSYVDDETSVVDHNMVENTEKGYNECSYGCGRYEVSTYEGLVAAFENDNAYVIMLNDITGTATENSGYGKAGVVLNAGDVLDGNNYTLTIYGANSTWDCVIAMKGGEVRNLTIAGAMRGVFMPGANGNVVIDNCVFKDVIYTFNSDAGSEDYTVTIKNTTLNGWTSFSAVHGTITFENCTFGEGYGYAFCRPYQATTFVDCEFNEGFEVDTANTGNNTLAFNECTYAGEPISAENGSEMFYNGGNVIVNGGETHFHKEEILEAVEPTYDSVGYTEGVKCAICGEILVPQEEIPALVKEIVTIYGANLDLLGQLVYNLYFDPHTYEDDNYFVLVQIGDDEAYEIPFANWIDNGSYKQISIPIVAKDMAETISVRLIKGDSVENGVDILQTKSGNSEFNDSVRLYAVDTIAATLEKETLTEKDEKLVSALVTLLNYGAAAQKKFDNETDETKLANYGIDEWQSYAENISTEVEDNYSNATGDSHVYGDNLDLEDMIKLNLYLWNFSDGDEIKVVVTYKSWDGTDYSVEYSGDKIVIGDDGYLRIAAEGLVAADINTVVKYTVTVNDTTFTVTDSIGSYCAYVYYLYEKGQVESIDYEIAQAVAQYGNAAYDYLTTK